MFNRFSSLHVRLTATCAALTAFVPIDTKQFDPASKTSSIPRVWRILFTGGPCGGKSTGLSTTKQFLLNHGFMVYTIPEASTILRLSGIVPSYHTLQPFQDIVTSLQTSFENLFVYYAKNASIINQKPVIILIDRGIMDGKAYITDDRQFCNVLNKAGHNIDIDNVDNYNEIFNRYDLILHLVSASKGAQQFYKQEIYRNESLHEAIELDDKLISIYDKHKNRRIIYNDLPFDDKIHSVIAHIADFVNIPNVTRTPLRYLVQIKDIDNDKYLRNNDIDLIIDNIKKCLLKENIQLFDDNDQSKFVITHQTKTFLRNNLNKNNKIFIRETKLLGNAENKEESVDVEIDLLNNKHYMLIDSTEQFGQKMHKSMELSKDRYEEYLKFNKDDKLQQVEQIIIAFYYRGIYLSLHVWQQPITAQNKMLLKVYRTPQQKLVDLNGILIVDLPECIAIDKNVTNDANHTSYGVAAANNKQ